MFCSGCNHSIKPGLQIVVDEFKTERAHCPYCLEIVNPQATAPVDVVASLATRRDETRKNLRGKFADRLRDASADGKLHCPLCERTLNDADERMLRENEYFRCHLCCHDLATVAYMQEAYHEQRWLPVVSALADVHGERDCVDCCYVGAIAKACQVAFSNMPGSQSKPARLLTSILRQTQWRVDGCEWESCVAVQQYRKTAGNGLLVL